jgi:hypothetical protein
VSKHEDRILNSELDDHASSVELVGGSQDSALVDECDDRTLGLELVQAFVDENDV